MEAHLRENTKPIGIAPRYQIVLPERILEQVKYNQLKLVQKAGVTFSKTEEGYLKLYDDYNTILLRREPELTRMLETSSSQQYAREIILGFNGQEKSRRSQELAPEEERAMKKLKYLFDNLYRRQERTKAEQGEQLGIDYYKLSTVKESKGDLKAIPYIITNENDVPVRMISVTYTHLNSNGKVNKNDITIILAQHQRLLRLRKRCEVHQNCRTCVTRGPDVLETPGIKSKALPRRPGCDKCEVCRECKHCLDNVEIVMIIITPYTLKPSDMETINDIILSKVQVILFTWKELLIDPSDHFLVPQQTALSEQDAYKKLKEIGAEPGQMPIMAGDDAVARYNIWRPGTLVHIVRPNQYIPVSLTTQIHTYRIVK
jgi:DNA-directed RNA polymerase subunit H (RpoH/RPB5)